MAELLRRLRPLDSGLELIRLGPDGDGGYLVPNDLEGIDYGFSPGVSEESGFEAALADRGMRVFLADHSVDGPAVGHAGFVFDKRFIGGLSDDVYLTLEDWKCSHIGDYGGDLLLQMDIEGAELEALLAAPRTLLTQFRIMIVEFHALDELWNAPFFNVASRVFAKLLQTHGVVHIHPNNCCGAVTGGGLEIPRIAEFTLLRNDRFRQRKPATRFPHPLDRNNTGKPTLPLAACWYR